MKSNSSIKILFFASILAIASIAILIGLSGTNSPNQIHQLTENAESLPDIEIMRSAAERAKDIFNILSDPLMR